MSSNGKTVLIVDDDDDLREILSMVLEASGYSAVGARDGAVALQSLEHGLHPAVILLDLRMPHIDGPEFLRHFRSNPAMNSTPIVVLSGEAGARAEADTLGVEGFLPKPVETEELVSTVQRYVGH